ncbi:MAG: hypothetical protein QOH36_1051 [Actinomycetota bacterium]|nr:hypothetical protein [Actinomycetota bacterium]
MSTLHTQVKRCLLLAVSVAFLLGVTGQGVAHAAANAMVSNQASGSGFPAGSQIYDSAMLGNGVNPTGLLTFKLFAPSDVSCTGAPLLTTTTAVNGNGYYESSRFVTNAAGAYQWTVAYGGDANNNPTPATLCSDPAGEVQVAKRVPNLNASPSWQSPSATDTASLTSGSGPTGPTGTITFALYGPNNMNCAGAPIFTSTRTVAGNGTYKSASFNPTVSGTYQWVVNYSGDANNNARPMICSDTANGFTATVAAAKPAVVSGSPKTVVRGGTITVTWADIDAPTTGDWVALYAAGTADGGAVSAWKYTGGGASGSVALKFPWGATAGTYELRLLADNNIQRLATSAPITLVW